MRPWSVEECSAYAKQLRDKSKANTAEHAAQAIEYLLGLVQAEQAQPVECMCGLCQLKTKQPLTDDQISDLWDGHTVPVFGKTGINPIVFARAIEAAHGIKGEAT